jgi:phosphoglycolate phosphatase-like HAD superfamily hydrolase
VYGKHYRYLLPSPDLKAILQRLRDSGKQLFICSNSPWYFVDAGMRHLMGPDWVLTSICLKRAAFAATNDRSCCVVYHECNTHSM